MENAVREIEIYRNIMEMQSIENRPIYRRTSSNVTPLRRDRCIFMFRLDFECGMYFKILLNLITSKDYQRECRST
jgi:hypothetical protein